MAQFYNSADAYMISSDLKNRIRKLTESGRNKKENEKADIINLKKETLKLNFILP
jgi:hypothetical protein